MGSVFCFRGNRRLALDIGRFGKVSRRGAVEASFKNRRDAPDEGELLEQTEPSFLHQMSERANDRLLRQLDCERDREITNVTAQL